jgi:hypothetical protein
VGRAPVGPLDRKSTMERARGKAPALVGSDLRVAILGPLGQALGAGL